MTSIEDRKNRHLEVSLKEDVQATVGTGFEDIHLIHRALPEMDLEEVDTETKLFGHRLSAPFIISAMTGGTEKAAKINENLAEAAELLGLGMGVGSQRIALEDLSREYSFRIVRDRAPTAFLLANLGCPQLALGYGAEEARKCVEMIDADALALHMNPLQEAIQMRGETKCRGVLSKIEEIVKGIDVPVVAKETGAGVSYEVAVRLEKAGVQGVDVSGVGGTSWSATEQYIAKAYGDSLLESLGKTFWNWGIPTAISVVEVSESTDLIVIASGGIRTGIDMAKAIALGADAIGMAQPLLKYAAESAESLIDYIKRILLEFRIAIFLVGAKTINELKEVPVIICGRTSEWLRLRGFNPEDFIRRTEI